MARHKLSADDTKLKKAIERISTKKTFAGKFARLFSPVANLLKNIHFTESRTVFKFVFAGAFIYVICCSCFALQSSDSSALNASGVTSSVQDTSTVKTVNLINNGQTASVNTSTNDVKNFLKENNISVAFNESVYPSISTEITSGMDVVVGYKTTSVDTKNVTIPAGEKQIKDYTLDSGKERVEKNGTDGLKQVTYIVEQIGNYEISRTGFEDKVIKEQEPKVVKVGANTGETITDTSEIKEVARQLCEERGWGSDEFNCLDLLWTKESRWDPTACNSSSGAYGIPQALPGSKMASFGSDWETNPVTQIKWGLNYIAERYGTPSVAWSHSCSTGWY